MLTLIDNSFSLDGLPVYNSLLTLDPALEFKYHDVFSFHLVILLGDRHLRKRYVLQHSQSFNSLCPNQWHFQCH